MSDKLEKSSFQTRFLQDTDHDQPVRLNADFCQSDVKLQQLVSSLAKFDTELNQSYYPETLPALVQAHFSDLWELARTVRELLRHGVPAMVIENLPFADLNLSISKRVFLAFATCIGRPMNADPHRPSLVWEVTPRSDLSEYYTPTITEHNDSAELHTDSAFKESPENYVLLFAYRPASDGGGVSQVLSARHLLSKFSSNELDRDCLRLLRFCSFPFRVPTVFTRKQRDADIEWVAAPILSDRPQIRFRYDLITSALESNLTSLAPRAKWALSRFYQEIQRISPASIILRRGDLLVLNNHLVLHGRSAFEDPDRMLLRLRLAPFTHPKGWASNEIRRDFSWLRTRS